MQIYSLPPACPDIAAYKPLYKAAAKRVQQDLGDLEAVCQDTAVLWPKLLQLPQLALYQLLASRDTSVASEDTVIYVIQSWAVAQQQQPTQQQMRQLCSTINLQNCSPMYLVSVLAAWPLVAQCLPPQDLALAMLFANSARVLDCMRGYEESGASEQATAELTELRTAILCFVAAGTRGGDSTWRWLQNNRRPSDLAMLPGELDVQHAVPLRLLEDAVTTALAGAAERGLQEPAAYRWNTPSWQGRTFSVWLQAEPVGNAPAAAGAGAAAVVSAQLTLSITFGDDMPHVITAAAA
jgi:hypothetical protein